MGFSRSAEDEPGEGRATVRAICSGCNTEVELTREESTQILDAGIRPFRRHLVEVDTACRECGTNRRKLVVSAVGRR